MPDFASLFSTYRKEAFRLELLPEYNVSGEWERFEHFLHTGTLLPYPDFQRYLEKVGVKILTGATHTRMRVVDAPLTPYQDFEIKMAYIPLLQTGASIFVLERAIFEKITASFENVQDFWLFDDMVAAKMQYDETGRWLGAEVITDISQLKLLVELKTVVLNHAKPLSAFLDMV